MFLSVYILSLFHDYLSPHGRWQQYIVATTPPSNIFEGAAIRIHDVSEPE